MRRRMAIFIYITAVLCSVKINVFAEPDISARAAILTELTTGRALYSRNSDERLPMASTTKVMTALVAIESAGDRLDEIVEISESASGVEGSSMYLEKGEKMTLRELLYGLMLSSGNDAAVAIAENVGGSVENFAEMMNEKARELGLENTHFTNPNGLPDENHFSSAADMARMTEAAVKVPAFAEIVGTKSFKIAGEGKNYARNLTNHNKLLDMYEGCTGVKTGFTKAAGRCLVSCAERGGMKLVCVTLNAPDDWRDHTELLNYGFSEYHMEKIADKNEKTADIPVENSYDEHVAICPGEERFFPMKEGESFAKETDIPEMLTAPLEEGYEAGRLILTLNSENGDNTAIEIPLVTEKAVEEIPAVKRFGAKLGECIIKIFSEWINKI